MGGGPQGQTENFEPCEGAPSTRPKLLNLPDQRGNRTSESRLGDSVYDGATAVATLDSATINVNHAVIVFIPFFDDYSDAPACGKQNVDARIRRRLGPPQPEAIFLLIFVLELDPSSV